MIVDVIASEAGGERFELLGGMSPRVSALRRCPSSRGHCEHCWVVYLSAGARPATSVRARRLGPAGACWRGDSSCSRYLPERTRPRRSRGM